MVAGLNVQVDVWRMTVNADDDVGGALVTGTVVYRNMPAALTPRRPSQLSLDQGLETDATYDLTVRGRYRNDAVTLYERDEVRLARPTDHPLYGLRFRITGVGPSRRRPRHGHQHCTLSRIRESRSQQ